MPAIDPVIGEDMDLKEVETIGVAATITAMITWGITYFKSIGGKLDRAVYDVDREKFLETQRDQIDDIRKLHERDVEKFFARIEHLEGELKHYARRSDLDALNVRIDKLESKIDVLGDRLSAQIVHALATRS